MRNALRSIALAVGLMTGIAPAVAQTPRYNLQAGTVLGCTVIGPCSGEAIPFASLIATMLATNPLNIPNISTSSVAFKGSASGQATVQAQAAAGTPTINLPTISGTLADSATPPIVLDPVAGTISCPTCSIGVPSRTAAIALNLAAYSAVTTQGYAAGGDGGNATFTNVGAAPFIDTSIATGSITAAGSGCTNATYYGVQLGGGHGTQAEATVVASGGVVSSVTLTGTSPGYSVSDVLSGTITGCTFTWTVATITAPTGSFSDAVGTHFQITMPAAGIDLRAFGVKFDWTKSGGDAAATDNFATIFNAYTFAAAQLGGGLFAQGGANGGRVLIPRGTAMYCGSNGAKALMQPYGVTVKGQGDFASVLKPCDAWGTATNMYELCNSQSHLSCFLTMLEDAQIYVAPAHDAGANVATLATVYSNNCQQENCGLRNVEIFSGACRQAYKLEIGYGGASLVTAADGVSLLGGETNANCNGNAAPIMSINLGTTQVTVDKLTLDGFSSSFGGPRADGLVVNGGFVEIHALIAENVLTPLLVNIPTSLANGMVTLQGFEGDQGCVWFASLANTNEPGNFSVTGPMAVNSCSSGLVQDAQSGGSNMTSPQVLPKAFNP